MPRSTVPANATGLPAGMNRKDETMGELKVKPYPGLTRIAPQTIEARIRPNKRCETRNSRSTCSFTNCAANS